MRVKVLDYYTHEPISCGGSISYNSTKQHGDDPSPLTTYEGISNDNGVIVVKYKIQRREYAHKLEIWRPSKYGDSQFPFYSTKISPYSDGDLTVYIKGQYPYNLRLHNLNCSGPTDSLFISGEELSPKKFAGCVDTLLTGTSGKYRISYNPNTFLTIISKKNGVYDTLSQNFNLTMNELNEIIVNY